MSQIPARHQCGWPFYLTRFIKYFSVKSETMSTKKQSGKRPITLYTVTTLGGDGKDYRDRTPAVCTSLTRAKEIIERNEGSLNEAGYYPLAVIEAKPADLVYPEVSNVGENTRTQWWYRFSQKKNRYLPCRRPVKFRATIGFGIG